MNTVETPVSYDAPAVEELRQKVRNFIRDVVMPAEPRPGETISPETLEELRAAAKQVGVFAPHVSPEFGGQGLPLPYWPAIFQEACYSSIGPSALNIMAPDEGNMRT